MKPVVGDPPTSAYDLVMAAKDGIENLSVDAVQRELASGQALLIDVRESEERIEQGFIAGDLHLPRGMLEWYADPMTEYYRDELEPTRRLILYCSGGGRSALGVRTLNSLGYTNVAHLDGGLFAWVDAGKPVVKARLGM